MPQHAFKRAPDASKRSQVACGNPAAPPQIKIFLVCFCAFRAEGANPQKIIRKTRGLGSLGRPGGAPRGSSGAFGGSRARLGASWGRLGPSWGRLGPSWAVLAASWGPLGPSWRPLGASWRPRPTGGEGNNFFGGLLGPSWAHFWVFFG